jgi:hypothetical protein
MDFETRWYPTLESRIGSYFAVLFLRALIITKLSTLIQMDWRCKKEF